MDRAQGRGQVNPTLSRHTVGVMGSGHDAHEELADEVGILLAELEVNLLTGGGGGVMRAVSRAFVHARRGRGLCIGIIPCTERDATVPPDGYPNEFIELAIRTHLPYSGERGQDPLSRNHINVLSSDAIVALPGSAGTASEVALAMRYGKPVIVYAPHGTSADVSADVGRATSLGDVRRFLIAHITS